MSALQDTWSRFSFEEPELVEKSLVRGALWGASAAMVGLVIDRSGSHPGSTALPVTLATATLLVVLPRQRQPLLFALVAAMAAVAGMLGVSGRAMPYFFSVGLGAVLAMEALTPARRVVALVGPSLGVLWCSVVAHWLSARHLGAGASLALVAQGAAGLFVAIGASLAWVSFAADTIEPKLLAGPKVRHAWLRIRNALGRLPGGETRASLEALSREGAERWVQARREHDEALSNIDGQLEADSQEAVAALTERLGETTDAELKEHLAQLLRVHRDTLEQLAGLRRRVERAEARVAAEAGWLETAAFSVELAPRSASGLGDLVTRLRALSQG